ncbi:MAG: hypothetical protein K2I52_00300 [Muribaculaceae bacterium]|nr:hypothetical protein [Muribaculaceae bacterium]
MTEISSSSKKILSYESNSHIDSITGLPLDNYSTETIYDDLGEITDTTYYTPEGYPRLNVKAVAGNTHVRIKSEYDALGRLTRRYLPEPTALRQSSGSIENDSLSFIRYDYPLCTSGNPVTITQPGESMKDHPTRYEYICNSTTVPMLRCNRYRLSPSDDSETITKQGEWPGGALDVTRSTDPDGNISLTFADWHGRIVLERRVLDNTTATYADTYYLYDLLGRPRVIVQPSGTGLMKSGDCWDNNTTVLQDFAFIMRYDSHGHCVYIKQPGAEAVEMRFDPDGRLAFRATATMLERGKCELYLYDISNRPVINAIADYTLTGELDSQKMMALSSKKTAGYDNSGYLIPIPLQKYNPQLTTVLYYDNYDCLSMDGFDRMDTAYLYPDSSTVTGHIAGKRTAVYSTAADSNDYKISPRDSSLYSLYVYDQEGRVKSTLESTVIPDTQYETQTRYGRQGKIKSQYCYLTSPDTTYTYRISIARDKAGFPFNEICMFSDSLSRSSETDLQLFDVSSSIRSTYNELGQLQSVIFRNNREISYQYNLRGQPISIISPFFRQTLKYEDGDTPCYNGNISSMVLRYGIRKSVTRNYTYDNLDRLISMTSTDGFNTSYSYNLNSSPLTVSRNGMLSDGTTGIVDELSMSYDGNRLTHVDDYADQVLLESSLDHAASESDLAYDSDGRLNSDSGRGITSIIYSPGGQPLCISVDNGYCHYYQYSADGRRLSHLYKKTTVSGDVGKRYFNGPFEMKNRGALSRQCTMDRVNMPWGYIGTDRKAVNYVADYQGNVRCIMPDNDPVLQTTDYYPYGLPTATSTGQAANPYKYAGKELLTQGGTNLYDFPFRKLLADVCSWMTPDPMAILSPSLSPYDSMRSNPIKYIDPLGLYTELWRATLASIEYGGARVGYGRDLNEYYIALNSAKTGPYNSGGTLTRYVGGNGNGSRWWPYNLGPQNGIYRPGGSVASGWAVGGGGSGCSSGSYNANDPEPEWMSATNTAASAIGSATGIKTTLINYAVPRSQQTGSLLKYTNFYRNVGRFTGVINAGFATYDMYNYRIHGGNKWYIYLKYSYDGANAIAPIFSGPAAPYIQIGSVLYSLGDWMTDGYWLDYSVPNS